MKKFVDTGLTQYWEGAYEGELLDFKSLSKKASEHFEHKGIRGISKNLFLLREKKWLWLGVFKKDFFAGFGIVNTGYIGEVFAFCVSATDQAFQTGWRVPFGLTLKYNGSLSKLVAKAKTGSRSVRFIADSQNRFNFRFEREDFKANLEFTQNVSPVAVLGDWGRVTNLAATQKAVSLSVQGEIEYPGKKVIFSPTDSFGAVDLSWGLFPYRTQWQWACVAGLNMDGKRIGLNLCEGTYEQSSCHKFADSGFSENVLWVDGVPESLDIVRFEREGSGGKIQSTKSKKVDLTFEKVNFREHRVDLGVVRSNLKQNFGHFSGTVEDFSGRKLSIYKIPGVWEEHDALW